METRSEKIVRVFNGLGPDTMPLLHEFYAPDVVFEDPLGRIHGRDNLHAYYENMYKTVQEIRFDFSSSVVQDDTHVVVWTMRLKARGLNRGQEVVLDGNSVLRFGADDKVIFHRDYFDMGAFVYQHVPVLLWLVAKVNQRLAHK